MLSLAPGSNVWVMSMSETISYTEPGSGWRWASRCPAAELKDCFDLMTVHLVLRVSSTGRLRYSIQLSLSYRLSDYVLA